MVDTHLHSSISADSEAPMGALLDAALALKLTDICFTEHIDIDHPKEMGFDFSIDFDAYRAAHARASANSGDGMRVRYGLEIGMQPHTVELNRELMDAHTFDFVIGSVHAVDGVDIYMPAFFEGYTMVQANERYVRSIHENICLYDDFDVLGHYDYVVKSPCRINGQFRYADHADCLDAICKKLVTMGKGMEINTSVYLRAEDPRHGLDVLRRYRELGGEIVTLGSDAHAPGQVGYGMDRALNTLRAAGFRYYAVFERRKPRFVAL